MLSQGISLSGAEPNSCFLNLGTEAQSDVPQFADVSSAVGFNFQDDARGMGLVDWDFDGDVDAWVLNRSAPQLRFLQNRCDGDGHFVCFLLRQPEKNIDAIGARVEMEIESASGASSTRVETVRAGTGFLSQSSSVLHFGLKPDDEIKSVNVRWPGGEKEVFSDISRNQFHKLEKGAGIAKLWSKPEFKQNVATGELRSPEPKSGSKVIVAGQPAFPDVPVSDLNGEPAGIVEIGPESSASKCVVLWASWCPKCVAEIQAIEAEKSKLEQSGIEVLLLNVDERNGGKAGAADSKLNELGINLKSYLLDPEVTRTLELYLQSMTTLRTPMALPTSFVVNPDGQLTLIKKGPYDVEQLIADNREIKSKEKTIERFPGRWHENPGGQNPLLFAALLSDDGLSSQAISYLQKCLKQPVESLSRSPSEISFSTARLFLKQKDYQSAIASYKKATLYQPSHKKAHWDLAQLYYQLNKLDESSKSAASVLNIDPKDSRAANLLVITLLRLGRIADASSVAKIGLQHAPNHVGLNFSMGLAFQRQQNWVGAIASYRKIKDIHPIAKNNLAWILATASENTIRDGKQSESLAGALCARRKSKDTPLFMRTLAASYAEQGRFSEAIATVKAAIQEASPALERLLANDLSLYQQGNTIQ